MTDNEKRLAEALRALIKRVRVGYDGLPQGQGLRLAEEALAAHDAAQQAGGVGLTEGKLRELWCQFSPYIGGPYDFARAAIAEFCRINNYPLPKE